jgi:hypothetical protein
MKDTTLTLPLYGIVVKVNDDCGTIRSTFDDHPLEKGSPLAAAVSAIESMILSQACAGIDITEERYIESLKTTFDFVADEYGDLGPNETN